MGDSHYFENAWFCKYTEHPKNSLPHKLIDLYKNMKIIFHSFKRKVLIRAENAFYGGGKCVNVNVNVNVFQ